MKNTVLLFIFMLFFLGCNHKAEKFNQNIITSDIANFWDAYDQIVTTKDSVLQYKFLDSLYIQKGTLGLKGIMQARNYSHQDYIDAINSYPEFWSSVRKNTLKTDAYVSELNTGIEKIKKIYPELKPAKIYFTIGALRTPGTTIDSLVLIGSELAMTDKNTVSSEFQGDIQKGRRTYFDSNPIDNLVFLNVHEYVHTQQKPVVNNLLSYVLQEGIAEFVSVKALGIPSSAPAVEFGKQNDAVKTKFENELFYGYNRNEWLWSDDSNEFNVRDLGYYIGYQIAEMNYNQATDKQAAIKEMIELDYTNEPQIEDFVDRTHFFSKPLEDMYKDFDKLRPTVLTIQQFKNNSTTVNPETKEITVEFSEPLNGLNTSVDFGELGAESLPKVTDRYWEPNNIAWTLRVDLEPNKHYQILISNNFRTEKGIPLKPFLIEFQTTN
jgi:hypothetical protein